MPIAVRVNEEIGLRVVAFDGLVSSADLDALVLLFENDRDLLNYDSVYLLDAEGVEITTAHLDQMRRRMMALYKQTDFIVLRCSAWICRTESTRNLVEYWLTGRHDRDGSSVEFCVGSDLADAAKLFPKDALEAVGTGAGFREIARIATEDSA